MIPSLILIYRPTQLPCRIYDITYDQNGYPMFLVFIDGQWKRISAKHFIPHMEGNRTWN